MKNRVRIVGFGIVILLILLVAFVPAVQANPGLPIAGAEGHLSYTCPFAHTLALADFAVWQTNGRFDGGGWGVIRAPEFGITSRVAVKLVRVDGDNVYFAGTVMGGASWWYFAARQGTEPGAVGMYVNGRSTALALVAAGSDLSDLGGGFQPLEPGGWVHVW